MHIISEKSGEVSTKNLVGGWWGRGKPKNWKISMLNMIGINVEVQLNGALAN